MTRHVGPDDAQVAQMLESVGCTDLDALITMAVPESVISEHAHGIDDMISERAVVAYLHRMGRRNRVLQSLIGMGYHGTIMPEVIRRNVLENPGWYTAYTPYQAEISQGRLEALVNFQQVVIDLTGMEIANASMLDEATAAAEAMALARRVSKVAGDRFFIDIDCHPQTRAVVETRARWFGFDVVAVDLDDPPELDGFGVLAQYPGSSGEVRDLAPLFERAKAAGLVTCVAADPLALVMLTPPARLGADVVVGSMQRFGLPLGYGGPHAGYFATHERFARQVPGRIIGVSVDAEGRTAYRMALQTREQHIRREKATSNICTNQGLLALRATVYMRCITDRGDFRCSQTGYTA